MAIKLFLRACKHSVLTALHALEFPLGKKPNSPFPSRLTHLTLSFVDGLHNSNWLTSQHLMGTT